MARRPRQAWYSKMTRKELAAMVSRVGQEVDFAETRPLTAAMRKQEQRARRKKRGK